MKPITLILTLVLNFSLLFAQKSYKEAINRGDSALENGDFEKAVNFYFAAGTLDSTKELDIIQGSLYKVYNKLDRLWSEAKDGLEKGKQSQIVDGSFQDAKVAMEKLDSIERIVETLTFDYVLRKQFKSWKGFNNYNAKEKGKRAKILAQIDSLNLSSYPFRRIPFEVTWCPNLKYINLIRNLLRCWDIDWKKSEESLKKLGKNTTIYVAVKDLSAIDSSYWHLISGIYLCQDNISVFPKNILGQKQITYFMLTSFPATSNFDPSGLFELTKLKHLYLNNCGFDSLPSSIGNLQNLEGLFLYQTPLSSLPPEIGNLQNLTELDLSFNKLSSLPPEIKKLKKLKNFNLMGNNFSKEEKEKIQKWLPNCEIWFD